MDINSDKYAGNTQFRNLFQEKKVQVYHTSL
jgi:hypothetical protein